MSAHKNQPSIDKITPPVKTPAREDLPASLVALTRLLARSAARATNTKEEKISS